MEDPIKMRYELLRIYAEFDTEYQLLLQHADEAMQRLEKLECSFPNELIKALQDVISANKAVDQHMLLMACTYLVLRTEVESSEENVRTFS